MRSIVFVVISLIIPQLIHTKELETRHIHVIKIMDSMSDNDVIADGCRSIEYGLEQEINLMRDHLGITDIHYYDVSGIDFRREQLEKVLTHDIQYQERDIIVLLYAGHGYREANSVSDYPKLYLNGYGEAMEFDEIRDRLIKMNPSVLINMVIACNVTQLDQSVPPDYKAEGNSPPIAALTPKAPRRFEPYHRLFADQTGYTKVVDLVSARPEKFTFLTREGGIFFSEILFAFYEIFTDQTLINWDQICQRIEQQTYERSIDQGLSQQPICRYNIFMATDRSPIVRPENPSLVVNCANNLRQLRRTQRVELKELRRKHRRDMRELRNTGGDRNARRLLAATHRRERAEMMERHEQKYQRDRLACR
ncbi:MAG: hypothetical protein AAFY91_12650 [Bacteroidota bacterium]